MEAKPERSPPFPGEAREEDLKLHRLFLITLEYLKDELRWNMSYVIFNCVGL